MKKSFNSGQGQYIVLDMEFNQNEIIQLSAVRMTFQNYGQDIQIKDNFNSYVKNHKPLTNEFINLTKITEADVENASEISDVLAQFVKWIQQNDQPMFFVTWGNRDEKILKRNCAKYNCFIAHKDFLDLQSFIMLRKGMKKLPSLESQVTKYLEHFDGEAHNAIADATNMAYLLMYLLKETVF